MLVAIEKGDLDFMNEKLRLLTEHIAKPSDVSKMVFDTKGAAQYLKISTKTLEGLRKNREISFSQSGTKIFYKIEWLEEYIDKYKVTRRK